jgi:hypothetical protein
VALASEAYLRGALDDIHTVAKLAGVDAPEQLVLYTSPAWKSALAAKALAMAAAANGKFPMGQFMGDVMQDPEMRTLGKTVQAFTGKLPQLVNQWTPDQRTLLIAGGDEAAILAQAAPFIASELGVAGVQVFAADDDAAPKDAKQAAAAPLKPGILLR